MSRGSHEGGTCHPCIFFISSRGCSSESCGFCHLPHARVAESERPRRAKRDAIKERIFEVCLLVEDEGEKRQLLQNEALSHPFAWNYIKGLLDKPPFDVRRVDGNLIVSI